jgi:hypothetical protein
MCVCRPQPKPRPPGTKPPADECLPHEVGVLITGCQDTETSADASPAGDHSKAHGALSNALHTVVRVHHEQNPGTPLTYRCGKVMPASIHAVCLLQTV